MSQHIIKRNNIFGKIADYSKNQKIRQVLILYLVNILGIPLGLVTSIVMTKFLGAKTYGDYSFLKNIFSFAIVIFTLGFFQAGNRALILTTDKRKAREIYGAVLVILAALFITMALCLGLYGLFDTNLKEKGLNIIFFQLIPFCWIFLLTGYFETLFQADNRINELAETRLYPKIGFFVSVLVISTLYSKSEVNKLGLIWALYLLTYVIVYFYTFNRIHLSFKRLKINIREVWKFNKSFGFDVYLGSVFAVGIGCLSGVMISYFGKDNTGVGYYALAITFANPLTLIPNVIATTHYKDFSFQNKIPIKLTWITIAMTLGALIVLWIVVGPFIIYFYGPSFHPVIELNFIVSTGFAFHGLADYFNRFFGAHGRGKILRNSSIIIGLSLLVTNITLVPVLGEKGAAYSRLISGILYFFNMLIGYKLYCSNQANKVTNCYDNT